MSLRLPRGRYPSPKLDAAARRASGGGHPRFETPAPPARLIDPDALPTEPPARDPGRR